MSAREIEAFLAYLAQEIDVATSIQNQTLSAILFLYRNVLQQDVAVIPNLVHAERPKHLPTVLTHTEAMLVINKMAGKPRLMARLLYGSGLRLMECLRLGVKDNTLWLSQQFLTDAFLPRAYSTRECPWRVNFASLLPEF